MSKALKIFIVLIFLMAIAALVLSSMLFGQRDILKGRILKYEDYAIQTAKALRFEGVSSEKLKTLEGMEGPLRQLVGHSGNTYVELQDTKADLEATQLELAATQEKLRQTEDQLAEARNRISTLETELAQTQNDLQDARDQIANLENEKAVLAGEVEDLEMKLAESGETIEDLRAEVVTLERVVAEQELLISGRGAATKAVDGTMGTILDVNSEWNFVVLDVGGNIGFSSGAELLVHRSDRLIGKVLITSVEDEMAIADIVNDWQQVQFKKGDRVLYSKL
jgi:predicted RNase H-like nuclease (RuvC/YqgF family)